MPIKFACPECHKSLQARDETAGKKTNCVRCGTKILIPDESMVGPPTGSSRRKGQLPDNDDDDDNDKIDEPALTENAKTSNRSAKSGRKKSAKSSKTPATRNAAGISPLLMAAISFVMMAALGGGALVVLKPNFGTSTGGAPAAAPGAPAASYELASVADANWRLEWDLPKGWKHEGAVEDGMLPWCYMRGEGQEIRVTPNRSLLEFASTATAMGGADERLKMAHTVRGAKLPDEYADYLEPTFDLIQGEGQTIVSSDFSYKGLLGRVHGVRITLMGEVRPYTIRMECSEKALERWRPVIQHVAQSLKFINVKDEELEKEALQQMGEAPARPLDPNAANDPDEE